MSRRKRYAQVGIGGRSMVYTQAIVKTMKADCELVGLCDNNRGRLELRNRKIVKSLGGKPAPIYLDTQFDAMIREQKPDVVVIATTDCHHDKYIVRAMELGCDVITEKPMTIDARKCQRIVDAVNRTGRDLKVTFNCRYMPPMVQVKDLLMQGTIGKILSLTVHWNLDMVHGASYYRRWHGEKAKSGGLLLHKSTHHLDLANWFLSANPVEVYCMGAQVFYGAKSGMVERYGLKGHGERCLDCPRKKRCPLFMDLKNDKGAKELYLDNERYDGYWRDRCVFHKKVDADDTMNLVVRYDTGAFMSYALNSFAPWEGFQYAFNGTNGRLEFEHIGPPLDGRGRRLPAKGMPRGMHIRVYPHFKPAYSVPIKTGKGSHWGGDDRLMNDLFGSKLVKDPYLRSANYAGGAMSILIGAAANESMRANKPIEIADLVKGLPPARLPKMKE